MSTTLHLFLGSKPSYSLPEKYITRKHMIALHMALLELLIIGHPSSLWTVGCLHRDVPVHPQAHIGPYITLSLRATTSFATDRSWSSLIPPPASTLHQETHSPPTQDSLLIPLQEPLPEVIPETRRSTRSKLSRTRAHIPDGSPLTPLLSTMDIQNILKSASII